MGDHSCSPTKFDSGQGSDGSATGSQHSVDQGDPDSPGRTSSSSSQISSVPSPDASLARQQQDTLLDTSDESSLDSLELDQVRYILKPKVHKYNKINNNNNNNNITNKNASRDPNKP